MRLVVLIAVIVFQAFARKDTIAVFTKADSRGKSTIALQSTFTVALRENPSTGYEWHVTSIDSSRIVPEGKDTFASDTSLVGAGGTRRIGFRAVGTGVSALKLAYYRIWEAGKVPPIDSFQIIVKVTRQHH